MTDSMLYFLNRKNNKMKNLKKFLMIFLAASISTTFSSCEDDEDDITPVTQPTTGPTQNIAEIAIADSRTDSLVVALETANLVATFTGTTEYTVFAPTNQAFINLLGTNSAWNRISDIDATTLTNVLLYHVTAGKVFASDLTDNTYINTLNTQGSVNNEATVIEVDIAGGAKLNNSSNVEAVDIEATNGVIHIIDAVLLPRNIVELAIIDERFTSLVAALTVFGDTLTGALSGNGPFTVFAPTNDAFQRLLDSDTTWNSLSDIPRATLNAVLTYHVVSRANAQADEITQDQVLTTLNGSQLTVDLSAGAQLITSNMAQGDVSIIVTDVQGTNGVIHAVENVLLP